ncbi:deoxyribodipyrimidine photo-lyase [Erwinia sp. MMLR14_017]|uniref:deoxyribodipyrimidine photo-lyase n=1 Tax=Erwinia sp. MMLR14_017 TaxID=3093842 RepID=UPI00399F01CE
MKDTSNRQWLFICESLNDLSTQLHGIGGHLTVMNGTVTGALSELRRQIGSFVLHSHEETGNLWTFDYDKDVSAWCRTQGCDWFQYAQNGVCRPVKIGVAKTGVTIEFVFQAVPLYIGVVFIFLYVLH